MRKPNWKIINKVRQEKQQARDRANYREVEPGVWIRSPWKATK